MLRCSEKEGNSKAGKSSFCLMIIGLEMRGTVIFFCNHNIAPYFTVFYNVSKQYARRRLAPCALHLAYPVFGYCPRKVRRQAGTQ